MHIYGGHKSVQEEDLELQMLKRDIIRELPHTKEGLKPGLEKYWPIGHEVAMIDGIAIVCK